MNRNLFVVASSIRVRISHKLCVCISMKYELALRIMIWSLCLSISECPIHRYFAFRKSIKWNLLLFVMHSLRSIFISNIVQFPKRRKKKKHPANSISLSVFLLFPIYRNESWMNDQWFVNMMRVCNYYYYYDTQNEKNSGWWSDKFKLYYYCIGMRFSSFFCSSFSCFR